MDQSCSVKFPEYPPLSFKVTLRVQDPDTKPATLTHVCLALHNHKVLKLILCCYLQFCLQLHEAITQLFDGLHHL